VIHIQFNNKANFYSESTELELIDYLVTVDPFEQRTNQNDEMGIWYAKWYFWGAFSGFIALNFFYSLAHGNSMAPLLTFVLSCQ